MLNLLNSVLESDIEKCRDVLPMTSGFYWSISSWWDSRCRAQRKVEAMNVGCLRTRWLGFWSFGPIGIHTQWWWHVFNFWDVFGLFSHVFPGFLFYRMWHHFAKICKRYAKLIKHYIIIYIYMKILTKLAFFCVSASRPGKRTCPQPQTQANSWSSESCTSYKIPWSLVLLSYQDMRGQSTI